jgi:hypothetical protein|nr:hypothetical protein [Kofleriaceae bacterium]
MPVVRWTFIVCTLLGLAGVFLPSIEVDKLGHRATLSLYRAQADRASAARFIGLYRASHMRGVGDRAVGKAMGKTGGKVHDVLDNTQGALEALDDVSEDDAREYGRIAAAAVWTDLALATVALLLVLGDAVQGSSRRGRMIAAAGCTLVCFAIALVAHAVCAEAVFEANDELGGANVLALGWGAYAMPGAIAGALISIVVGIVIDVRARRR